jgi:hypothetical protein
MSKRLVGVPLVVLLLWLAAVPAFATEAQGAAGASESEVEAAPPAFSEVCGAGNEVVDEYCPEPYEAPSVFRGILWPLLGLGGLVTVALFLLYLRWLPNFMAERRARARGRR